MGVAPPPSAAEARRRQLADFLRARRAAVSPESAGLPGDGRRRTPGLRREEVAQLSGVGLSWYTWLEQARDVTPSAQVLHALARALHLGPAEREHLFALAAPAVAEGHDDDATGEDGTVDDETLALLDGLMPHLAYVLSPRLDVLAHNPAAELIMHDLLTAPPGRRNLLRWLFAGQDGWSDDASAWAQTARANLVEFRAEYDRRAGDPRYTALVEELRSASGAFAAWWGEHAVEAFEPARKRIPHPEHGRLDLLQTQARPTHRPGLRLRILVPADERTRRILLATASG